MPIHIQQEPNQRIGINVIILFAQRHKGQNQRVLLSNLIDQNGLRACLSKGVEDDC
jgi:hypothetical protein